MLTAFTAVLAATCALTPQELTLNPFNSSVSVVLLQLPALAAGVFWPLVAVSPMQDLESAVPQGRLRWLRAAWFLTGAVALAGAGAAVYLARWPDLWGVALSHVRNGLLGLGLGTVSGMVLPKQASWVPATAFLGACWLAGTTDNLGTAAAWAVPCYPAESAVAATLALGFAIVSGVVYSTLPARSP